MAAIPELDRSLESAYRAHYPALIRRARRWLPPDEAEDLVQETFLRAWMHHGRSSPGIPWLMTVLRNLAIDRSRRIHPELTDDPASLETGDGIDETAEKVVALEDRRRVRDALASLTAQQRAVITLREWAGMTQQEIASSLGTTVPSVESLLLRGRRRLKKALTHAMAAVLWPTSELWRRMKGSSAHSVAGSSGAVSGWSSTVASLATAATVVAAGAAAPLGAAGRGGPPPEVRVVAGTSAAPHNGGTVENTPTERAAASGERLLGGGTTGSGSSDAPSTGSGGSAGTSGSGTGSASDEGGLKSPGSGTKPTTGERPNLESDADPESASPSGPPSNGDADPTGESETPGVTPPETATMAPGASLST
jgi:RNA polymerase sigma-70 factor (ECF subfamily)